MSDEASSNMVDRLAAALGEAGIEFARSSHREVRTSAEAAEVRGTSLHSGAKALIVKGDHGFVMLVMPADMSLHGSAARKRIDSRRMRFATPEELLELTGLLPGSIPPFGSLFNLKTICDERLGENELINFNAGSRAQSIQMSYRDYVAFESPVIAAIAKFPDPAPGGDQS